MSKPKPMKMTASVVVTFPPGTKITKKDFAEEVRAAVQQTTYWFDGEKPTLTGPTAVRVRSVDFD